LTKNKRILVCPLDWGLGHASRMIPVINKLILHKFEVIIAADNYPYQLLKQEFSNLEILRFSSCNIRYATGRSQILKILMQFPAFCWSIWKEHQQLKKIIKNNKIDIVISDNRFGLWSNKAYSIFVTHQISIKIPKSIRFMEGFVNSINRWFISRYNRCWIPDFQGSESLAGELSNTSLLPQNCRYIGSLSRFSTMSLINNHSKDYSCQLLAVLSGPEPQRTIFEKKIIDQAILYNIQTIIIQGKPKSEFNREDLSNITLASHLPAEQLKTALLNAENIICRSGYTSIMDLMDLQLSAILVPTPGQTEQEYLSKIYQSKGFFYVIEQDKFNLKEALIELKKINPPIKFKKIDLLDAEICSLKEYF